MSGTKYSYPGPGGKGAVGTHSLPPPISITGKLVPMFPLTSPSLPTYLPAPHTARERAGVALCQHVEFRPRVLSGRAVAVVAIWVGPATELVRAALRILLKSVMNSMLEVEVDVVVEVVVL